MRVTRFACATALASSLSLFASVASAQTAADQNIPPATASDTAVPNQDQAPTDIVITGSRIRTPNEISAVPITTIPVQTLTQTARTSIGDALNDLPQLQSTYSQSNSTRFLGTGGLNLLDLRGLGTQRTLVLVNGRRHVGSDILNNAVSVDVNTIPTDLIEAVDIVTGGNSAVYGSDAIAGVVNFRLKNNFSGLQLRGQGGVSDEGDAGSYFASVTAGTNFADGRGNIAINGEYTHSEDLFASDRKAYRTTNGFITSGIDASGPGVNGNLNFDGRPDAVFFRDIRSGTIFDGGLVAFPGAAPGANTAARCGRDNLGRAYTCNYLFQPGGGLTRQTGTAVGIIGLSTDGSPAASPAGSSYIGGNGNTRREGTLVQLLPRLDRYAANLIGHFDVSDSFVPFIEAKYVRTESLSLGGSGPAFYTGSTIDGTYERPRLDNPYLSGDARAAIAAEALAAVNNGVSPTNGNALTAAQQATLRNQIAAGSYRFILRKNLTDLGSRTEDATRETYRIVGGVRGDFAQNFNYEISANYGEFKERTRVLGNIDTQRLTLALDAVRDPASGQIVCGAKLDRNRANAGQFIGLPGEDLAGNAANLDADIAACQPLNPFGIGSATQAARDFILRDTTSRGKITQFDVLGTVGGDTSAFFNLPGGGIGVSVGAEYRRETNSFRADPFVEQGYTFYNALAPFDPPAFEVKEAFGEVRVPLLKDTFLSKEVTLSASGRVSDYKGSAGTVYTYNLRGEWAPIQDIKFRANYGRAVRAPNLVEQFSAAGQNFAPGFADPCSADNIASGTQFRAANCAAAGIPTDYNYQYAQSLETLSGGNADLNVEKSDSYTYGAIVQPRFVPGLTLSVDYYNIKVNNVITSPTAQDQVNACYDSPSIVDNQFCATFQRVAAGETGPNGEQSYRILEGTLLQIPLNYARLQVRGIDFQTNYSHRFGDVRASAQVIYSHFFQNDSFLNPAAPGFADRLNGEVGYPKDQVSAFINADFGPVYLNTSFRYLSKQSVGEIENHETTQGRPPQNLDDYDIPFYPDVLYIGTKFGINVTENSDFYFGIDNITDRLPPLGSTGIAERSGIFDNIGRRFYAGVTARF